MTKKRLLVADDATPGQTHQDLSRLHRLGLSDVELQELFDSFLRVDYDHSGSIDAVELSDATGQGGDLGAARGLIGRMQRREVQQKAVLTVVAAILIAAIGTVAYYTFSYLFLHPPKVHLQSQFHLFQ